MYRVTVQRPNHGVLETYLMMSPPTQQQEEWLLLFTPEDSFIDVCRVEINWLSDTQNFREEEI